MCWLSKTCTSEEEQKRHARVYRETREPYCRSAVRVRPVGVSRNPAIDQLGRGDEPLFTCQRCAAERLWHACGTSEPAPEASFTGGSRVHGAPDPVSALGGNKQGRDRSRDRIARPHREWADLCSEGRGTVLDFCCISQPGGQETGVAVAPSPMPVAVSLLDASDTGFPPCPDSNLVSVLHSGMSERTRVAEPGSSVWMSGNEVYVESGDLPEKAIPNEESQIPAQENKLEDGDAHEHIPVTRGREVPPSAGNGVPRCHARADA